MNTFKDLLRVRQAGDVKRWHTKRTNREQTLAAHQWGVALIIQYVDPTCRKELIMAALTHDNTELDTGDVPAPAKWTNSALAEALETVEKKSSLHTIWGMCLTQKEHDLLKWADSFELLMHAQEEVNMGNLYFTHTVKLMLKRMDSYAANGHWPVAAKTLVDFIEHQGDMTYEHCK